MCIRDSIGIKKGEKIDYAIFKDGNPTILIECKHWAQNLNIHDGQLLRYFHAVSYTHLRAHETVLDLVCRLLLEKKNKHITKIQFNTQHTNTMPRRHKNTIELKY